MPRRRHFVKCRRVGIEPARVASQSSTHGYGIPLRRWQRLEVCCDGTPAVAGCVDAQRVPVNQPHAFPDGSPKGLGSLVARSVPADLARTWRAAPDSGNLCPSGHRVFGACASGRVDSRHGESTGIQCAVAAAIRVLAGSRMRCRELAGPWSSSGSTSGPAPSAHPLHRAVHLDASTERRGFLRPVAGSRRGVPVHSRSRTVCGRRPMSRIGPGAERRAPSPGTVALSYRDSASMKSSSSNARMISAASSWSTNVACLMASSYPRCRRRRSGRRSKQSRWKAILAPADP